MTTAPPRDDYYDQPTEATGFQPPTGNYDRYILPEGDGGGNSRKKEYTSVTTVSGSLDNGVGLGIWKTWRVAWGVAQRDDLVARLRGVDVEDRDTIREVVKVAETVGRVEEAANLGTAFHAVLQRVDQGEDESTIHPYFHPVVANYREALERAGLRVVPEMIERVCRNSVYDTGGRFDNIYEEIDSGTFVIGDKKTLSDRAKDVLGIEIQLAIYAHSEHVMNYDIQRYEPMPPVRKDYAVVVHIDTESMAVTILRCDIECGWAAARVAMEQRELRRRKHVLHDYSPNFVKPVKAEKSASPPPAPPNGHGSPEAVKRIAAVALAESYDRIGFTPVAATAPPASDVLTYAVDPATRVDEIMQIRKNDKARLQVWAKKLGCTDLNHHRKFLAEWIVNATPGSGAVEPPSEGSKSTLAGMGLPPAPSAPQGEPVIESPIEIPLRDIHYASSVEALGNIWARWTAANGPDSWTGELEAAGNARAAQLRATPPRGDAGPPF